ncbi:MAG TPA: hypothetical protein VG936_11545 [Lacunisphaera sp.]|nr:hypothetical protein [Lacunisphaera sp.]
MSLNRIEQIVFDYWSTHPEERRHWQAKALEFSRRPSASGDVARDLERELKDYVAERSPHVPTLRAVQPPGATPTRLLNLAEYILRLWGAPKPKKPEPPRA